ncbi:hypothetical protein ACWEPH_17140 [Nocardia beijingensis]|uniref:hypothetical protein n=1 Tax=Nocardia beijingensis TaxID=95162 RepID=UPI001893122F|nr:hypothetical protein [Nocardia beijingensis]MBF6073820.1 hypothetical protein [Nocardia beijingensis]
MPAQDRRYLVLLNPGDPGDDIALTAIRAKFFDWLRASGAEVVEDGGANRVVITSSPETAQRLTRLEDVRIVEPYA